MSPLPDPEPLLAAFVRALREVDPDVTAVEIADALFLTARVQQEILPASRAGPTEASSGSAPAAPPGGAEATGQDDAEAMTAPGGEPESAPAIPPETASSPDVTTPPPGGSGSLYADVTAAAGERARRVRAPAGRALSDPLGVARALRPLMRRVPSRTRVTLDVEATVEHVAALRLSGVFLWLPVMTPEPERWLTVDLLVDVAPTMAPWQETADELHHLLEGSGGFRAVRRWGWDTTAPGRPRPFHAESPGRAVARLPAADGQHLVVAVTDCLGERWRDGTAFEYLADAGATSSVALVQVLPRHLWSRTALGDRIDARVRAAGPAAANRLLRFERLRAASDDLLAFLAGMGIPVETGDTDGADAPKPVPLPVTTLESSRLAPWARLVAGRAGPPILATLVAPGPRAGPRPTVTHEGTGAAPDGGMAGRRLVEAFRGYASPGARQLAVYLTAVAPLTLSIMRVVRDALIPDPSEAQIAEVLMSGLLREIAGGRPRDPAFDWIPDAQRQLAFALNASDLARVTGAVTDWMNARVGSTRQMTALTPDPLGTERLVITERTRPFAEQQAGTLRALGADEAAARLDSRLEEHRRAESQRGLELQRRLRVDAYEIFRMAWSPDGRWLATPTVDGSIVLWEQATGRLLVRSRPSQHGINEITWSPDGARFAAACYDGRLRVWSVGPDGQSLTLLGETEHGSDVRGASWSPSGNVVAAGCESGLVRLSSTPDGSSVDVHPAPQDGAAVCVAWSPEAALLAVGFWGGAVAYLRRDRKARVEFLDTHDRRHDGAVTALRWSPRPRLLVTGHYDGAVIVRDPRRPSWNEALAGHDDTVTALAFSPDGRVLVSKAMDGRVRFWRADTWEPVAELLEPSSNFILSGLAWNPRHPVLATLGDRDRSVRVWHVDVDGLLPTPVVLPTARAVPVSRAPEPEPPRGTRDHALVVAGLAPDPTPLGAAAAPAHGWPGWLVDPDGGALPEPHVRVLRGKVQDTGIVPAPTWDAFSSALREVLALATRERAAGRPPRRLYVYFSGRVLVGPSGPTLLFSREGGGVSGVSATDLLADLRQHAGGGRFEEIVVLIEGEELALATPPAARTLSPVEEPGGSAPVRYFFARYVTPGSADALTRTVIEGLSGPAADPATGQVTSESLGLHLTTHPSIDQSHLEMQYSPVEQVVFRTGVTTPVTTVALHASAEGMAQIAVAAVPIMQVPVRRDGATIVHLAPGVYDLRHDRLRFATQLIVPAGPAVTTVEITPPASSTVDIASPSRGDVFVLEALKADHGSAFLLQYGAYDRPRIVLFDGGPAATYRHVLRPRLEQLRSQSPDNPVSLELVAVSHGDDDNIRGILDLLSDMRTARGEALPPLARIRDLWYNDLGSLLDRSGMGAPGLFSMQSRQLTELARQLGVSVNGSMHGALVASSGKVGPRYRFASGLTVTVLGPSGRQIESILGVSAASGAPSPANARQVPGDEKETGEGGEEGEREPRETAGSRRGADRAVANVLSLVLLLEFRGRAMLLCGDARGDDIVAALHRFGLMRQDRYRVDLLVVPHHGTPTNVTPAFFRHVVADHYVFTGRGARFPWPAPRGVEMLLDARDDEFFTIHFNHAPGEFDGSYPLRALLDRFERDRNAGRRYQTRFASQEALALVVDLEIGPG
jgi:WD40 repeat protein/beta-lactamase superfamily II metal-dependent hydrolase